MTLTLTGQKPADISPVYTADASTDFDPAAAITEVFAAPAFVPVHPSSAVVLDEDGNPLSENDVVNMIFDVLGETPVAAAESRIKALWSQSVIHYNASSRCLANSFFVVQAACAQRMPLPTPGVIYSTSVDIIPAAKTLLSQAPNGANEFTASLGFIYRPSTFGVWVRDDAAFENFKTTAATVFAKHNASMTSDDIQRGIDLQAQNLGSDLTWSLLLRRDETEALDPGSFSRVLVEAVMTHATTNPDDFGLMPFSLEELFIPKSMVFANAEAHARATPTAINKEWAIIKQAISSPPTVLSSKKITQLTAAARNLAHVQSRITNSKQAKDNAVAKAASLLVRKSPPTSADLFKQFGYHLKRMGSVTRSMNVRQTKKTSFVRANRREPSNYNKPGNSITTKYIADIHLFADFSGSMSEENTQQAIIIAAKFAKKHDVNIYFSSFSHVLSAETKVTTRGRSVKQILRIINKIPKVSGGTDYDQIWDYINHDPKRRRRMNIIVTDFEWSPGLSAPDHPKNLFYAPVNDFNWDMIKYNAESFAQSMLHIDPMIKTKMLGIYA